MPPLRILIVEDEPLNLKLFRDLLAARGYEPLTASDGLEAVRVAREELPDLVLMDIQLPGLDGIGATAALKADPRTSAIPVIAITSLAMKGDEERIADAGCDAYLTKPIEVWSFLDVVERFAKRVRSAQPT